jgi:hypothetical protein
LRRWLYDDAAADRKRWRHFVSYQIERKIEWRNRRNGPGWLAHDLRGECFGSRREIDWEKLSAQSSRFLRGESECHDRACGLASRKLNWLAAFARNQRGEILASQPD